MAEDELKEVLGRLNEGGQGGVDCRPRGLAVQLEAGAEGEQKGPGSGSGTSATSDTRRSGYPWQMAKSCNF